jgi:hypothetical protein
MGTSKKKVEPTAPKSGIMSNKSGQTPPKKSPLMKKTVKDACYKKVKASYDVFPSAYASGAIAKCRKAKAKK